VSKKTAVRTVDGKGRVTLPASFANATVLVEQTDANTVVIRRAVVTPVPRRLMRKEPKG
jgi:bifunctional DNA-binding transcriptional regulator/antitoxin component of YhaV-PrlF toxin-antitoxin module